MGRNDDPQLNIIATKGFPFPSVDHLMKQQQEKKKTFRERSLAVCLSLV